MKLINLAEIITAKELLERWPGVTENELVKACDTPRKVRVGVIMPGPFPKAYFHKKSLATPDGEINKCENIRARPSITVDDNFKEVIGWGGDGFGGVSKGIVFDLEEVQEIEELFPEHLYPIIKNGQESANSNVPDYVEMIGKAKRVLNKSFLLPSEAIAGLLELVDAQNTDCPPHSAKTSTQMTKASATIKDYSSRMPEIVEAILVIKADWDKSGENSPKKKHGYAERELAELAPNTSRNILRAIKAALSEAGVKVWSHNKPRPSE